MSVTRALRRQPQQFAMRVQPAANGADKPSNGGGCSGNNPNYGVRSDAACQPPNNGGIQRGLMPTIVATCKGDAIVQPGRIQEMWVPDFVVWNFFARGADFSPIAPIQASGTKGVGALTLTLNIPVAASRPATLGPKALVCGLMVSISTSANTPAGDSTISFNGTFEDGTTWDQTSQWSQGAAGTSRFIQYTTKEVQGGAYPALVELHASDYLVVGAGVSAVVTSTPPSTTALSFTNGIAATAAAQDLVVEVEEANQGTSYIAQTLSPVSDYFYWGKAYFDASTKGANRAAR